MRGSLHIEEMDFTHMDDDVGADAVDFRQHIDTKHHGQHVADEMDGVSMDLSMDYGDTYLGMGSLVAVVTRPRHSGERVSTYVARMFALCRKVDILDE